MANTILFLRGIPEAIIRKLIGHRSGKLERYEPFAGPKAADS
jgi:hypothetical protein